MTETLLGATNVLLFGRIIGDIKINAAADAGSASPMEQQLRAKGAAFARIYNYRCNGMFMAMPQPIVLLVHGDGLAPAKALDAKGANLPEFDPDIRVWSYDLGDFSIRLDMTTGPLAQLLLPFPMPPFPGMSFTGMSSPGMSSAGMSSPGMSAVGMSFGNMAGRGMSAQAGHEPSAASHPFSNFVGQGMSAMGMSIAGMSALGMSAPGMSAQGATKKDED